MGDQGGVGALFDNFAKLHDVDLVGVANGGEAMGDRDRRAVLGDVLQRSLDGGFGFVIDGGSGFIQNQDRGIFEQGAGDRQSLALTAGKLLTAFSDDGFVAVGQAENKVVGFGEFGGMDDFVAGDIKAAVGNVFGNGAVKQEHILADPTDAAPQIAQVQLPDILAIQGDAALLNFVEA